MIDLRVQFDHALVDAFRGHRWPPLRRAWARFCRKHGLARTPRFTAMFEMPAVVGEAEAERIRETARYLEARLPESVAHVLPALPRPTCPMRYPLVVALLPLGRFNVQLRPGMQAFSLRPDADPFEAYLFLIHVYYHELSGLAETARGRRMLLRRSSRSALIYWLRLLIRNEGIGNLAVLEDLLRLRDRSPSYDFRYFTYAHLIGNRRATTEAIRILAHALSGPDSAIEAVCERVQVLLKNKEFPLINLIGIHMAQTIARHHGFERLVDVYGHEPEEFFALYKATGDLPIELTSPR